MALQKFITDSRKIHGDYYSYDRVVYSNNKTNVEIGCPLHDYFWQRPDHHKMGIEYAKLLHPSISFLFIPS